jgi:hypothetical protein
MPGISFFRFPREENRRKNWIAALRRDKWTPTKWSRICSAHFISGTGILVYNYYV